MRALIVTTVVLIHLLVIGYLVYSGRNPAEPEPSDSAPPTTRRRTPDTLPEEPDGPSAETPTRRERLLSSLPSSPQLPEDASPNSRHCKACLLVDWTPSRILWHKQLRKVRPIASLTKMMTALLLMEHVQASQGVSLQTEVRVTQSAYRVGGSQVYMDPRETFTVDEILKSIMIFSANDAAHLSAEFVGSGDVERFVERMNERASMMGLDSMHFSNPHGLPTSSEERDNRSNVLDLAVLTGKLLEFPRVLKWSSTWLSYLREDTGKPFQLVNRNRLVHDYPGVTGMKTGFTNNAGFCLAATWQSDSRTLIAVVTGCPSSEQRNELVSALLTWAREQ